MTEFSSIETPNIYPNLNEQQQFRINKISEARGFFYYFDKSLIVLTVTGGSIVIASFAIVIGAPVGIASASLSLVFSVSTDIAKNC